MKLSLDVIKSGLHTENKTTHSTAMPTTRLVILTRLRALPLPPVRARSEKSTSLAGMAPRHNRGDLSLHSQIGGRHSLFDTLCDQRIRYCADTASITLSIRRVEPT